MAIISFEEAAHLLRRMGFGGPPEEIQDLVGRGREGAVDYLLNYGQIDNSALDIALEQSFDFSNPNDNRSFNQNEIRRWWIVRFVLTRRQFEEKMTLFWHNHFATAISKVNIGNGVLMFLQNQTLRRHALDRFDTLLLKVAQDPAMLVWLDGITNVRGQANENFARELQELFTMGITDVVTGEPNYTEEDVKEIARAFTGWRFRRARGNDPFNFEFLIDPSQHDNGPKEIYGQIANFSGEDVVQVLAARRATARFLVKKVFDFFVYPLTDSAADKATIEQFADVYVNGDHSIKALLRAIFVSDQFYSSRARFAMVKNPVEFIVGAIRMLGGSYKPGTTRGDSGRRDGNLYTASRNLGMDLFNPPDVAGWDLNLGWMNTATALNRFNFANQFATLRFGRNEPIGAYLTIEQLMGFIKANAKKTVKKLLSRLGPLEVSSETVKTLRNYLLKDDQGVVGDPVMDEAFADNKIRGLIHQILSLPEFQLN